MNSEKTDESSIFDPLEIKRELIIYRSKFNWRTNFVFVSNDASSDVDGKMEAMLRDWDKLQEKWIDIEL